MKTIHCAMSVDVDRHTDKYLRERVCPGLVLNGRNPSVEELRIACNDARIEGLRVFPPCDNTLADGSCAGHDDEVTP